ncbi:cysteine-rich receptor-like protein kinase 25 isoform X1 [Typha latifolia]|uniref:cysteine-rich receptor-like protein kinase 25 isoform X1 n=1 Tax=Typha latifolia TaxID=4733 RepID=UPI003C2E0408
MRRLKTSFVPAPLISSHHINGTDARKLTMALTLFSNLPKLLLLLFLLIILHTPSTKSLDPDSSRYHYCTNDTDSTSFKANRDLLLSSLTSAASVSGFSNNTKGQSPDQVYGVAQCRGDLSLDECRTCLNTIAKESLQVCSNGSYLDIFHDYCILRYSDKDFFGQVDASYYRYRTESKVKQLPQFNDNLGNLMTSLKSKAAYGDSSRMFAAGMANYTSSDTIYGLVQCTMDLSNKECDECLSSLVSSIPDCCNASTGARVYGRTCIIRYDSYLFYNITSADELPSPPPAVPAPVSPPSGATPSNTTGGGTKGSTKVITIVVISAVAASALIVALLLIYFRRRKAVRRYTSTFLVELADGGDEHEIMSSDFQLFDLGTLKGATNNFSDANKLGEGGFGPVYKGTLQGGQEVAVKRLAWTSSQGLVELRNEVVLLAKLQHRNLVRLLGFCLQEKEKLLVYEYLPQKSLDKFLFDSARRSELDWGTRFKIIEGISRGLLYLHEDSRLKIVHRDLKVSNILLDGDMNAKISDFGLAKLVSVDETQRNTSRIAGTFGYMAPEYALHGFYSTKSDVFSYGVLVLEILTGRKNSCYEESGQLVDLLSYVWQHWIEGKGLEVIDRSIVAHCQSQVALRCIHIGLLCVQEEPSERPNMTSIILMLSSSSITLQAPKPPAFLLRSGMTSKSNILDTETSVDSLRSQQFSGGAR